MSSGGSIKRRMEAWLVLATGLRCKGLNCYVPMQGTSWSRFGPAYTETWPGSYTFPYNLSPW